MKGAEQFLIGCFLNIYDLHSHSSCSDGALAPEDLVRRAADSGVSHLALTDHDTLAGIDQAMTAAEELGITFVPGIEFSSQWQRRGIHIVGLNVDVADANLIGATEYMTQRRQQRSVEIDQRLSRLGFKDCLAGALHYANGGQVGRPHFAQHLVAIGAVKDIPQAFKRYLGAGKVGDVGHQWPTMDEVIGWINQAGGVAVIAHPLKYQLTRTKLLTLCADFITAGGRAIEIVSGTDQSSQQTQNMVSVCQQLSLYGSIGSDFHKPGLAWQALGGCGQLPAGVNPVWSLWS